MYYLFPIFEDGNSPISLHLLSGMLLNCLIPIIRSCNPAPFRDLVKD